LKPCAVSGIASANSNGGCESGARTPRTPKLTQQRTVPKEKSHEVV
jgi:hypothetical protein